MKIARILVWLGVAGWGAVAFAAIAWRRGEPISAMWLLAAAVCTYAMGYRFYSKFVAAKVLTLDEILHFASSARNNFYCLVRGESYWLLTRHLRP
ncbi:MAG TPA: carbon starvation CstA family protein [Verrucomicrobiae bacterium]|nr:carbon starvation CstA family protein [Verrucomicrobiae bacterium]